MFALIDCNNFYASCERLFRPDLRHKPIVVLSNNDGCIIARSNEAKALGIPMGEPFYKAKELCSIHKVAVFSSNYTLYGDLSQRVMRTIYEIWPEMEIYSIDEAFIDLSTLSEEKIESFCIDLQKRILQYTGIPTSIGIGKTKTLAKVANHIAKKILHLPVFFLKEPHFWLPKIEVGKVWGVGKKWQQKLKSYGIVTAFDLAQANHPLLRSYSNVTLMRTAMELAGSICLNLAVEEPRQSIVSSKSFGQLQTQLEPIAEALSSHCASAWKKMRKQKLVTNRLSVFLLTNRFRTNTGQYHNHIEITWGPYTDDLRILTRQAKKGLAHIFKNGYEYHKVGVMFLWLTQKQKQQLDLFDEPLPDTLEKTEKLMQVIVEIQLKFGKKGLHLASEGTSPLWYMKSGMKSPRYTTHWEELCQVTC